MTTGYLVVPELFTATEVDRLRTAAEQVHAEVVAAAESGETEVTVWPDGHRLEEIRGTTIHWEPDAPGKAVRSLAPVAHLHPALASLWTEPRLTSPMSELIGAEVGPFVSKLNFKRAGVGSEFAWHQDFPYWYCCAGDPAYEIATAIVMLDDNTVENGAMTLMFPGLMVHRSAPNRTATDRRSLLFCFQPAGRPELSALTYDAERLAELP